MTTLRARPALDATHQLAEGPVWDAERGSAPLPPTEPEA